MKYQKILDSFTKRRILVVGDLILDRYIWGTVRRISPEAPVPIVEITDENFLLGGASNVAHNIVSLGAKATVVGVAGRDRAGDVLREILNEKGILCNGIVQDARPTTVKTRIVAHSQQVVRFDRENRDRVDGRSLTMMLDYLREAIPSHDAVIISDYKKGVVSQNLVKEIVRHAKPKNVFVAVDPKVSHFRFYKGVSIVTPNLTEASSASGIEIKDEKTLIQAGKALLKKIACDAVLITRGEHGMSLFEKSHVVHIPTVAQQVFDVTGAGDTVVATFALAHVSGANMEQSAVIANHAAGIVVGEVGTAVVTPDNLGYSLTRNSKTIK